MKPWRLKLKTDGHWELYHFDKLWSAGRTWTPGVAQLLRQRMKRDAATRDVHRGPLQGSLLLEAPKPQLPIIPCSTAFSGDANRILELARAL